MFLAYLLFIKNACALFIWQLFHIMEKKPLNILRNIILLLLIPIAVLFIHIHWLFFILDELIFFTYRKTKIKRPLFIIGVPRSGTTYLQRTLATDQQFTSTTLADCLFMPSISQRYLLKFFKLALNPFSNLIKKSKWQLNFFKNMQEIHTLGLNEPEEDFFMLTCILSCFIQMTIFPKYPNTWKLADFDKKVSNWEKSIIMNFYKKMVQKHIYFYGKDKTYLAKNPSFTSWIKSLQQSFDNSLIIACTRDPNKTVPSQISSLAPIFNITKHDINDLQFNKNIHSMLLGYYQSIELHALNSKHTKNRFQIIEMNEIKSHLYDCIQNIYRLGPYQLSSELDKQYYLESQKNKQFKSNHKYIKTPNESNPLLSLKSFEQVWPICNQARLINQVSNHQELSHD